MNPKYLNKSVRDKLVEAKYLEAFQEVILYLETKESIFILEAFPMYFYFNSILHAERIGIVRYGESDEPRYWIWNFLDSVSKQIALEDELCKYESIESIEKRMMDIQTRIGENSSIEIIEELHDFFTKNYTFYKGKIIQLYGRFLKDASFIANDSKFSFLQLYQSEARLIEDLIEVIGQIRTEKRIFHKNLFNEIKVNEDFKDSIKLFTEIDPDHFSTKKFILKYLTISRKIVEKASSPRLDKINKIESRFNTLNNLNQRGLLADDYNFECFRLVKMLFYNNFESAKNLKTLAVISVQKKTSEFQEERQRIYNEIILGNTSKALASLLKLVQNFSDERKNEVIILNSQHAKIKRNIRLGLSDSNIEMNRIIDSTVKILEELKN